MSLLRKFATLIRILIRCLFEPQHFWTEVKQATPASLWRCILAFPSEEKIRRQLRDLQAKAAGRPLVVMPAPSSPWRFMVQRPQQLAAAFARAGAVVLYATQNYEHALDRHVRGLRQIDSRLYLFDDGRNGRTLDVIEKGIVWQYWASQSEFTATMPAATVRVYDWLDETDVHGYDARHMQEHHRLIRESDLTVATAQALQEQAGEHRDDIILLPNGADFEFFANPYPMSWPALEALVRTGRPIIGYYGVLAAHLDFHLVAHCARRRRDWTFLMVGPVLHESSWQRSGCASLANVIRWDHQLYAYLPHLLSCFTVATIPFKVNHVTRAVSPVKLFEYMSGGKPVVCTDLPECRGHSGVLVARHPIEFAERLEEAMALVGDEDCRERLVEQGRANSWDVRAQAALAELGRRGLIDGARSPA